MTTELQRQPQQPQEPQPQEPQPQQAHKKTAAAVNEVGAKVSSLRDAILSSTATPSAFAAAAASSASDGSGRGSGGIKVARNEAGRFARKMMQQSWIAQTDAKLLTDVVPVLEGGCVYLPSFLCAAGDFAYLKALTSELTAHAEQTGTGMINWSQHLKFEQPDFSPTFKHILRRLEEYFDVEILATRLNFYKDGSDWKPFHHDSHAYGANGKKEDFTMGASFGATRELAFRHEGSGQIFTFPQGNGDIFAFDSVVNAKFTHGVPKIKGNPERVGPRFSLIAWGRRRSLNERNSSETARKEQQPPLRGDSPPSSSFSSSSSHSNHSGGSRKGKVGADPTEVLPSGAGSASASEAVALPELDWRKEERPPPIDMDEVARRVAKLVVQEEGKKKPGASTASAAASVAASTSASSSGNATKPAAAVAGEGKAAAAGAGSGGGSRRRGRVQHSWAS